MKGADRNRRCPCGSGKKAKHCRGPHLQEIEEAYRENEERDRRRLEHSRRGVGVRGLVAMAAALGLHR